MAENTDFSPFTLPGFSQDAYNVALKLDGIPTLSELAARLGALPRSALDAAVRAEPAIYAGMIKDAQDGAAYLRLLADGLSAIAARLQSVSQPS